MNSLQHTIDNKPFRELNDRDQALNKNPNNIEENLVCDSPPKSYLSHGNSNGTADNRTKKESLAETDDSFEVFLPLKPKNTNIGRKKLHSPNKIKKKNPSSSRIRSYFSKRKSPSRTKEDRDLQLALARSLADVYPSEPIENISDVHEKKKNNSVFLKKFTSNSKKPGSNSLLLRRTVAERQSILTQKVAIILIQNDHMNVEDFQKEEVLLVSSVLEGNWDKNSTLWELSKTQLNSINDFYVNALEKFIEVPTVTNSMPEVNLSKEENDTDVSENMEIENSLNSCKDIIQLEENYGESCPEFPNDLDCKFNISDADSLNKINFINKEKYITESLSILSDDMLSLLENNEISGDVTVVLKTAETLSYHSFMLKIRCPSVLFSSESSNMCNTLDFSQYSVEATRAFFKYLYSGKIEFIYSLSGEDKNDLLVLAKKYNVNFLEQFILSAFHSDSFHIYSQSTCSPPHSPCKNSPDSTRGNQENLSIEALELSPFSSLRDKQSTNATNNEEKLLQMAYQDLGENGLNTGNNPFSSSNPCSSKDYNSFEKNSTFLIDDNSSYDIFKDDIKYSVNSSILNQNESQTKRKLNYANTTNETKKLCSEEFLGKITNSPEIITLDSDSNEEFESADKNDSSISIVRNFQKAIDSGFKCESSFEKYFDASFPSINEHISKIEMSSQQNLSPIKRTPNQKISSINCLTPLQKIIIDKATPKPDFRTMVSPDLKVELKKYGIKPDLDKEKALSLLFYIYDQIHPKKTEVAGYISPIPSTSKKSPPIVISDEESDESYQKDNRMKLETDFAYEEHFFNQSMERDETFTNQNKKSLKQTLINFFKSDMDLFSDVLSLKPLLMKKFYMTVKEHGIQCSKHELMDVLDDLYVNYQVEKSQPQQKKINRTQKKKPK